MRRYTLALGAIAAALVFFCVYAATDWASVVWRFTSDSVLAFGPRATLQDEDASWTITHAELGYLAGVTSDVQTQLAARTLKAGDTMTGLLTVPKLIVSSNTASRVIVTDANKYVTNSTVTATEIGYVGSVTGAIQTQIEGRVLDTGDTITGDLNAQFIVTNASAAYAIVTDADRRLTNSTVTAAELAFVSGVTGALQTQMDAKAAGKMLVGTCTISADNTVTQEFSATFTGVPTVILTSLTNALPHLVSITESNFVAGAATTDAVQWIAVDQ